MFSIKGLLDIYWTKGLRHSIYMRSTTIIGLRVNFGPQAFYREHGIEPCCGMCVHFQGELIHPQGEDRICLKHAKSCSPGDVCYSPERSPGADDV